MDLDLAEKNIATMSNYCRSVTCNLRPHVKAHKSTFIGKKQLAAGAIGLCAQTLDEADAMILGGLDHVLITNMLISENSVERFLNLAHNSDTITTVDSLEGVEILGKAANHRGLRVGVLVEIDVGQKRTGVEPGENAAKLAAEIARTPGLEFRGLMGYEGFLQLSIPEFEKRKAEVHKALSGITKSIAALRKAGLEPEIVTSGGTGTYNITAEFEGVTEIQPGSYITMDHMYNKMETCGTDFKNSLTVHSTVVSTSSDRVVIDMGWKAASVEYQLFGWDGMAHAVDLEGATYFPGGDEHGILKFSEGARRPALGDRVKFIPSHCDTTLNLYSKFYAVRGNKVELVCPIAKR
jgi:3-hydroxy-D-aspartate aldolase